MEIKISHRLTLFMSLLSGTFYAQDNIEKQWFLGKWKECIVITSDTVRRIDSAFQCKGKWQFEFLNDGTYKENAVEKCNGKKYQAGGEWAWDAERKLFVILSQIHCSNGFALPEEMEVCWLSKDKWVIVSWEGPSQLAYLYYERVEERKKK